MILIPVFLLVTVGCRAHTEAVIHQQFKDFQKLYRKNYSSGTETEQRFNIFKENLNKIRSHNKLYNDGNVSYELDLNHFADWTKEDFSRYVNKFQITRRNNTKIRLFSEGNVNVPRFVDWRLQSAVTDVRNQGHCGSCWAFSAVGALEGQAKIVLQKRVRLSEQNLIDCADAKYFNHGCDGGDFNNAYSYVAFSGIQDETSYHYVASQGRCRQKSSELYVDDYYTLAESEEALKYAVATIGPISVAIESTSELQHYSKGIFYDHTCTNKLNHGVLVVGYGEVNGEEYWLIKNSWGPSWGEQGYFRLARNRFNNCGVASYAGYPVVTEKKSED